MWNLAVLMVFAGTLLYVPAFAQNCENAQSQMELNQCSYHQFQTADAALNVSYQKLMAKLSPEQQASLRKAERSWVSYRDNECAFETIGSLGGSINALMVNQCEMNLTVAQMKRLDAAATDS